MSEAPREDAPDRTTSEGSSEDRADAALAAAGDQSAFGRLHARHAERVHRLARRFVGADAAREATQDIFVRAWEKLHLFRGESGFGTWLHRLAVNALLRRATNAARLAGREVPVDMATHEEGGQTRAPDAAVHAVLDVQSALERLDKDVCAVVVLHDLEGYSHHEIADLLAISPGASRMRLHRARTQLRSLLL